MQVIITAYDGQNMLEKRMAVRARHLENIAKVNGTVVCAGGILNESGSPIGSVLVMDFAEKAQLDEYLESEPYIQEKVWEHVKVEPMNVVILNNEKVGK